MPTVSSINVDIITSKRALLNLLLTGELGVRAPMPLRGSILSIDYRCLLGVVVLVAVVRCIGAAG